MYLTNEAVSLLDPNIKFSIKAHMPMSDRTLLYDILLYTSVRAEVSSFCSQADLDSFLTLLEYCDNLEVNPQQYVACAYKYIDKYATKGHKIPLSYFLNDSVVEFVGSNLDSSVTDSLLMNEVLSDILTTEKYIRSNMSANISYASSLSSAVKQRKVSKIFLAYKVYCKSDCLKELFDNELIQKYIKLLEPFFVFALGKNKIFTPYNITTWNNSKIEDFSFCPIYFKARYVTHELCESLLTNEATATGTAVHKIFEDIIDKYNKNRTKPFSKIAESYFNSSKFKKLYAEQPEIEPHLSFTKQLLLDDNSELVLDIISANKVLSEEAVNGSSLKFSFYGTADLILLYDNKAIVYDFKTSKIDNEFFTKKNNNKYAKQLSLYAKLLEQMVPNIESFQLKIIYTRGKIQEVGLIDDIVIQRSKDISNIIETLRSGLLEPNTSSCMLCTHPFCSSRAKESMWDSSGKRKNTN